MARQIKTFDLVLTQTTTSDAIVGSRYDTSLIEQVSQSQPETNVQTLVFSPHSLIRKGMPF
jgi:hypothetical protein